MKKALNILLVLLGFASASAIGLNLYMLDKFAKQAERTLNSVIKPGLELDGFALEFSGVQGRGFANKPIISVQDAKLSRIGAGGVFKLGLGSVRANINPEDVNDISLNINGPIYIEESGVQKTEITLPSPVTMETRIQSKDGQLFQLKGITLKLPDFMEIGAPDAESSKRYRITYTSNPQLTMMRDGIGGEKVMIRAGDILISSMATSTAIFKIEKITSQVEKTIDQQNPAIETIKTDSVWEGMAFTAYLEVPILQHLLTRPAIFENKNTLVIDKSNPTAPVLKSAVIDAFSFKRQGFEFGISGNISMADGDPLPVGEAQVVMSSLDTIISDLKATNHVSKEDTKTFSEAMFALSSFGYTDESGNLNFLLKREAGKPLYVGDKTAEEVFTAVSKALEPALKEVPVQENLKPENMVKPETPVAPETPEAQVPESKPTPSENLVQPDNLVPPDGQVQPDNQAAPDGNKEKAAGDSGK